MGVVTDGLVGYWHYAQGVNGTVWQNIAPSTVGQYNGTLNSGVSLVSDGLNFDGSSGSYVSVGAFHPLEGLSNFTIQVLLQLPDANTRYFFNLYNSSTQRVGVGYSASKAYSYYVSSTASTLESINTITTDSLVTLAVSSTQMKIYINSTLDSSIAISGKALPSTIPYSFIGCDYSGTAPRNFFLGKIRAVRVYNRELTQTEIQQNYNLANSDTGIAVVNNYIANLSDSVIYADSLSKYFTKSVNDKIDNSDNMNKNIQYLKSDFILTADERYMAITKEINEIVNVEDTFSSKLARMITLIDSIYASEDHSDQIGYNNMLTDSVILEDTIIKSLEKIQADYISTGDIEEDLYNKILTEAISPTDNFATVLAQYRYLFDTVKITDAIVSVGNNKEKLIDLLLSTEITREIQLSTKIEEEIQLSAEITKEIHLSLFL